MPVVMLAGHPVVAHCCLRQAEDDARDWEARRIDALAAMRVRDANLPESVTCDLAGWLDAFTLDSHTRKAYGTAIYFAAACAPGKQPSCGMTLHGEMGAGKTTLAAALARTIAESGVRTRFENFPHLVGELRGLVKEGGCNDRLRELTRVPVLVLDDVGREQVSYFSVETVLYDLVDARYRAGLPMVLTTNFSPTELERIYASAGNDRGDVARNAPVILDRLKERCAWLKLGGVSRRKPRRDF